MSDLIERLNAIAQNDRFHANTRATAFDVAAELVRLSAELTIAADAATDLQRTVFRLTAEVERLRANDGRYRWLREQGCNIAGDTVDVPIPQNDGSYRNVAAPCIRAAETLDAAIDAAIKEAGNGS